MKKHYKTDQKPSARPTQIYGYVALGGFTWEKWAIAPGELIYIGVTNNLILRDLDHSCQSKKKAQLINKLVIENYHKVRIAKIDFSILIPMHKKHSMKLNKSQAHELEKTLINIFQPRFNIYGKGGK